MNNTTKYFVYINRAYKNVNEIFVVSQTQLPTQTPVIITDNREEAEKISKRFNSILKEEMNELSKEEHNFFFNELKTGKVLHQLSTPNGLYNVKPILSGLTNITVLCYKQMRMGNVIFYHTNVRDVYYSDNSKTYFLFERLK